MYSINLTLLAIALLSVSGVPALFFPSTSETGGKITLFLMITGALAGLSGCYHAATSPVSSSLIVNWSLPWGHFAITIDAISTLFLGLIYTVPAIGSVYGHWYWRGKGPSNGFFYGLLAGAMALVVVSRDSILFLIAWEVMALAAFFAATAEDEKPEVRQAGWVYLVATHIGTLCLIAMFAFWRYTSGSFSLEPAQTVSATAGGTIFILAVAGFGCKAGILPLHVWLPGAHANAPSHVSAVMSGVMLKMGIYGIVRITSLLPAVSLWWGYVLLIAGVVTGTAGIAFAISQRDIKRILAYSSIENIGIICIAIGLALIGRYTGRSDLVILGMGSALLHTVNHGFFKSLLFLNAGAVIHATGTRDCEQMGGLAKKMPVTMSLFAVGAIAITALPPLNGFVSEWLLYNGLFRTIFTPQGVHLEMVALCAVGLALIGPLAIACFVKLGGTVFLGTARSNLATHAHEPSRGMLIPMVLLALGCVAIGLYPQSMVTLLGAATTAWAPMNGTISPITTHVPLSAISIAGGILLALAVLLSALLSIKRKKQPVHSGITWDCGYAKPAATMQYTGSSFGDTIVKLFNFILFGKTSRPHIVGVFPSKAHFSSQVPDTILDRLVLPLFRMAGVHLPKIGIFQRGHTHLYVVYIPIIIIVLLIWGNCS